MDCFLPCFLGVNMIHISFDDVHGCIYDLTVNQEAYNTVFSQPFLGCLQKWHLQYGAVFTLNCFNAFTKNPAYSITKFPRKYAKDLNENADWLKFSFHAENELLNYGDGRAGSSRLGTVTGDCPEEIVKAYEKFVNAILTAAGTDKAIDRVCRLGFFGGTRENVRALSQCPYGIYGLLGADDERISYYLDEKANCEIVKNRIYVDEELHLVHIHSQKRLERVTDLDAELQHLAELWKQGTEELEIFTHEYEFEHVKVTLEAYLAWAKKNKFTFGFYEK